LATVCLPLAFLYNALYYACFIDETLALASAVKAGADKIAGMTRTRYVNRLTWLRALSRFHVYSKKDDRQKSTFIRISNVLENLRLDSSDGKIREQPYCVILSGPPGCGKTSAAMRIAAYYMRARHGRFYPSDVVTLNETDDYQSEYRTNHKVVIFDDIGAENPAIAKMNPWRKVIDFVNNIKKTALNPNLELKGVVYIEPELVIMTTNLRAKNNFSLSTYMVCPQAIFRRFSQILYLDPDFKHCKVMSVEFASERGIAHDSQPAVADLHTLEPQTIEEFLQTSVADFLAQGHEQEGFVAYINSIFDSPLSTNNAASAFVDDVLKPNWFHKYPLHPAIEKQLPWLDRFGRLFCFERDVALYQAQPIALQPQAGEESLTRLVDTVPKNLTGRQLYLSRHFNCENFLMLNEKLSPKELYCPVVHGFLNGQGYHQILPEFIILYKNFSIDVELAFDYSLEELLIEFNRQNAECVANTALSFMELDQYEFEASSLNSHVEHESTFAIKTDFNNVSLTLPLFGFTCETPRNDPYMSELLETKPKNFRLVLREWVSEVGVGDLVFVYVEKGSTPVFIVVELKSHKPKSALEQSLKYSSELRKQLRRMYKAPIRILAVGMTPRSYDLIHICGVNQMTRTLIESSFKEWFSTFEEKVESLRLNLKQAPSVALIIAAEKAHLKKSPSQLTLDEYPISVVQDDISSKTSFFDLDGDFNTNAFAVD
jgi:DNA polymerase III delta prime subunit